MSEAKGEQRLLSPQAGMAELLAKLESSQAEAAELRAKLVSQSELHRHELAMQLESCEARLASSVQGLRNEIYEGLAKASNVEQPASKAKAKRRGK